MKQLLGLLICLGLLLGRAAAQTGIPPLKKEYLDSAGHVLPATAGAASWRETTFSPDSTNSTSRNYYLNGQLQSYAAYKLIRVGRFAGIRKEFDESGQMISYKEFDESKGFWEWRLYYPNGQLKRWERNGWLKRKKQCFAPDGRRIPFFEYEIPPRYPEGSGDGQAIIQAIKRLAPYPDDARQQRAEGRVFIAFTVTSQGAITDVQAFRPFLPSVGTAVTQAVRQLKPFIPAQLDGRPVAKRLILPIDFHLP